MNVEHYKASDLKPLFRRHGILTMPELKTALGTDADMTVFRKLKALSYRTSYSHGGRYYTLESVTKFNEQGLWCRKGVWFSIHGTLLATLEAVVDKSVAGLFASDLRDQLHVEVKESLLRLANRKRVHREAVGRKYLYCSSDTTIRGGQLRKHRTEESIRAHALASEDDSGDLGAALALFVSLLDERQRRLYAGLEALRIGPGGDQRIADLLGMHHQTVAKGRKELLQKDLDVDRVRRPGGGRQAVEKKLRRS